MAHDNDKPPHKSNFWLVASLVMIALAFYVAAFLFAGR